MNKPLNNNRHELLRNAKQSVKETQNTISALRRSTLDNEQLLVQQRENVVKIERDMKPSSLTNELF